MNINEMIEAAPKLILGPVLVLGGIVYFVLADPPKTVCDIQFDLFKQKSQKYFYGYTKNKIKVPPEIQRHIEECRISNSPGGCFDWINGLKRALPDVRFIPEECRPRLSELGELRKWLEQSLWLYSHVSWNNSDVVRSGLMNWLDREDIAIYCRLNREYQRLYGLEAWKKVKAGLIKDLIRTKKIGEKEVNEQQALERSLLSKVCL